MKRSRCYARDAILLYSALSAFRSLCCRRCSLFSQRGRLQGGQNVFISFSTSPSSRLVFLCLSLSVLLSILPYLLRMFVERKQKTGERCVRWWWGPKKDAARYVFLSLSLPFFRFRWALSLTFWLFPKYSLSLFFMRSFPSLRIWIFGRLNSEIRSHLRGANSQTIATVFVGRRRYIERPNGKPGGSDRIKENQML